MHPSLLKPLAWIVKHPLQAAVGAFAISLIVYALILRSDLEDEVNAHNETKSAWALQNLTSAVAAIREQERIREVEQQFIRQKEDAEKEHAKRLEEQKRLVDALSRTVEQLRKQASAAATGGRPASEDSVESCRVRATGLAELLGEVEREGRAMAAEAQRLSDEVIFVCSAWPRSE